MLEGSWGVENDKGYPSNVTGYSARIQIALWYDSSLPKVT